MVGIPSDLFSNTNRESNLNNGVSSNNRGNSNVTDASNVDLSKAKNNFAFITMKKGRFLKRPREGVMVLQQNVIQEGFNLNTKKRGLMWIWPWVTYFEIPDGDMTMKIVPYNDILDATHLKLNFHGITLTFSKTSVDNDSTKLITQIEGISHMRNAVSSIITSIINNGDSDDLKSLELDFYDRTGLRDKLSFLDDATFNNICISIRDVLDKYGLVIKNLRFGEHDLPKDMEDTLAEARIRETKREIAEKDAVSRLKIATTEAQAEEKKQGVPFKVLKEYSDGAGLSEKEYYELMKAQIISNGTANVTIVDGLGSSIGPILNPNNSSQNNQSTSNDGPTDDNQHSHKR